MRTTTAGEAAVLASAAYQVLHRFKAANGSGTMVDLSSWVESFNVDTDIDQPVAAASFQFRRDSATQSLSPLRTDSTLNRLDDGTTYSPQFDVGRLVTLETATIAPDTSAASGDWKLIYQGYIDVVRFEKSTVTVDTRDEGSQLYDRWIESEAAYGSIIGIALETTMQSVLDATLGASVVPLYTPTSPGFLVKPYTQQKQSMMDAQLALAQLPGWDARYRYDEGTSSRRFTLTSPPRSKTTPDFTFGPSQIVSVNALSIDRTNIRNVVSVSYLDSTTRTRLVILAVDSASIAKYGRRYMEIVEADTSPINTAAQATTLAASALSDLKDPKADQEIELLFWWPGDLWDLYRHSANAIHYNGNQDWAVVSIRHEFSRNKHRTKIRTRGSPAGAYLSWMNRGGIAGGDSSLGPSSIVSMDTFTRSKVTLAVSGVGKAPLLYRRRVEIDGLGTTTYPGWAAIGAGVLDTFTTNPNRSTRYFIQVQDADGNISEEAMFPIESWADAFAAGTGSGFADESRMRGGEGGGISTPGGRFGTEPGMDSTGMIPLLNPTARRIEPGLSGPGGTGMVDVEEGGNRGLGGFSDQTGALVSGATEFGGKAVKRLLAKTLAGDPDTLDGTPEGTTYKRVSVNAVDGSSRIDFSKSGFANKNVDNVSDGSTYARPLAARLSSGRPLIDFSEAIHVKKNADYIDRSTGDATPASTVIARLANTGHPDATMQATDGSLLEGIRGASRKAGAGKGYVDEDGTRTGDGGVATKGNKFSTLPLFNDAGTAPMIDPVLQELTTEIIPATGFQTKSDFSVRNVGGTLSFQLTRQNDEQDARDTDPITFAPVYDAPPQVTPISIAITDPAVASRREIKATGILAGGYTARAVYITGDSSTPKTEQWATSLNGTPVSGVSLSVNNAAAYSNLSNANANLTTYVAHFDVDTSAMGPFRTLSVKLYQTQTSGGSPSWVLVGQNDYGAGVTLTDEQISFDAAMAANYDLRLVITYIGTGSNATVVANSVAYNKYTPGTENPLTVAAQDKILFQARVAP